MTSSALDLEVTPPLYPSASPHIVQLDLGKPQLRHAAARALAPKLKLRHVELAGGDATAEAILKAGLAADSLHIECATGADLTDALVALARATDQRISRLSLAESAADAEDVLGALRVPARGPLLRALEWRGWCTDVAVYNLVHGGSCLTSLALGGHDCALTDDAVLAIASFCPDLLLLDLSDAARSTRARLGSPRQGSPPRAADGRHTDAFDATDDELFAFEPEAPAQRGLTDAAVEMLAGTVRGVRGCVRLVSLDVGSQLGRAGAAISNRSLRTIGAGALPQLQSFGVRGCAVSPRAVAELRAARPTLTLSA